MAFGFTDPALEIAQFARWFRTFPPANGNVSLFERISQVSGVSLSDPNFYELFSSVMARIVRLKEIIVIEQGDGNIDGNETNELLSALNSISNLLSPLVAGNAWQAVLPQNLKDSDITLLVFFSNQIQERYPFKLVPPNEIADVVQRIGEKIAEISDDEEIEDWAKKIICDGLIKLSWSIKHLRFFGHENILEQLMLLHSKISNIYSREEVSEKKSSLYSALVFIGTIATAFAAPAAAYNASKDYMKFINYAVAAQHERMITSADHHHEHHHGHTAKHDQK